MFDYLVRLPGIFFEEPDKGTSDDSKITDTSDDSQKTVTQEQLNSVVQKAVNSVTARKSKEIEKLQAEIEELKQSSFKSKEKLEAEKLEALKGQKDKSEYFETLLNQQKTEYASQIEQLKTANQQLTKNIHNQYIENYIRKHAVEKDVIPGAVNSVVATLKSEFSVSDDFQVKPAKVQYAQDGHSELNGEQLIDKFLKENPWFIQAKAHSGSDSQRNRISSLGRSERTADSPRLRNLQEMENIPFKPPKE